MNPTCVAIIERHGSDIRRAVIVPPGQSIEFDDGAATRRWPWPFLGTEWHLVEFLELRADDAAVEWPCMWHADMVLNQFEGKPLNFRRPAQ